MWQPVSSTKKLSPLVTNRFFALSFFCRVTFDCQTVRIPIEPTAVGPAKNISSSSAGVGGVEIALESVATVKSERTGAINLEIADEKKIRWIEEVELHIGRWSIRPALVHYSIPKKQVMQATSAKTDSAAPFSESRPVSLFRVPYLRRSEVLKHIP